MEMVCAATKQTIHDSIQAIGGKLETDMKGVYSLMKDPYLVIIIVNTERSYLSLTVTRNFNEFQKHEERLNSLNTDPTMGSHSVIENSYLYRQIQYFDLSGICMREIKRIVAECQMNAIRGFDQLTM
jgi:endonuclease V-like protein UPF0215 family